MATCTNLTLALTGPESSGKTTLAEQLANHYKAPLVTEVAREFMTASGAYTQHLIDEIGRAQFNQEQTLRAQTDGLLIADTDLTVIYVWSQVKFGSVNPWLAEQVKNVNNRCYLLMYPDLPWVFDPLRESPKDRVRLFRLYKKLLERLGAPFEVVSGIDTERFEQAESAANRWLKD